MRKRTIRKPVGMHPFLRQQVRASWGAKAVLAQLHALTGNNRQRLLELSGVLFFVACTCAMRLGWTGDETDMRIVRASVNALDDFAKRTAITDMDRGALQAGIMAAQRIIEISPVDVIADAAALYQEALGP